MTLLAQNCASVFPDGRPFFIVLKIATTVLNKYFQRFTEQLGNE